MQPLSPATLIELVIKEVLSLQGKTFREVRKATAAQFIPPSLPAPEGRSIWITPKGLRAVHQLGDWWKRDSDLGRRTTIEETHKAARRAFGQLLTQMALETLGEALTVLEVRRAIEGEIAPLVGDTEHFFRIHLFRHYNTDTLEIGPVRLETGAAWKARVIDTTAENDQLDPKHWDQFAASPWIGGVTVRGRTAERSREQAAACLRIALDSITLPMSLNQAREVRGPSDSFDPRRTETVTKFANGFLGWGGHREVFGLRSAASDTEEFIKRQGGLFEKVGEVLFVLTDDGPIKHQRLKRHWIEAMYWFGEARRSDDDFVALVKIGITLDVLAGGGKAKGIAALCAKLWGEDKEATVTSDGRSIEKLVAQIYNESRSRISHGSRFGLLEDLPVLRADADRFSAIILIEYLLELDAYRGADDPEVFRQSPRHVVEL